MVATFAGLDSTALYAQQPSPRVVQQPVSSFAALQSLLKIGDEVRVIDSSGKVSEGRIGSVSMNTLSLIVDGREQELSETNIREVKKRRADSRWNGMLIGAATGAAVGAVAKQKNCGSTDCGEGGLVDPGLYVFGAAIGAGAGAFVDRSIKRFDTVLLQPSAATARSFNVSAVLSREAKVLVLLVTF